ncbi:MAG: hypothetical protein DDT28_01266 [Dehalococcoidia bacterium]|nr:hypothetical protein [Chloroflexota bacterium]
MKDTKTLPEIIEILKRHKEGLNRRYKIKEIGTFGSYLKGEATRGSDLDILVEFEQDADVGLIKFVEIGNYLSDLLGIKVDLVEKSALKPRVGRRIQKRLFIHDKRRRRLYSRCHRCYE